MFCHTFVKRNRVYNKSVLYENGGIENVKERKERAAHKQRNVEKLGWSEVYQNYSNQDFKSNAFKLWDDIHDQIVLTPTNLKNSWA